MKTTNNARWGGFLPGECAILDLDPEKDCRPVYGPDGKVARWDITYHMLVGMPQPTPKPAEDRTR